MVQKLDQIKTGEIQNSGFDSGAIDENEKDKIIQKPSKFMKEKNQEDEKGNEKKNKEEKNINNEK